MSVTQLNDRAYLIQSQGNEFTSYNQVSKYALLRAADICIYRNFTKFIVLDEQAGATTTQAGASNTVTNCQDQAPVPILNLPIPQQTKTRCSSYTYTTPPSTVYANTLRVYLFKDDEESPPEAYDCEIISSQLTAYRN
ncbi:MAG: hypothetical protein OXU76_05855 [Alphaproteobacteria bacterium]|nr:hypothetical protein [Alphaproteobacteria bacterium]